MTSIFSTCATARMQATQDSLLTEPATLYSPTQASDGAGGQAETLGAGISVRLRMATPSGALRIIADRLNTGQSWQVTLSASQSVSVGQVLEIKGVNYRVVYVDAPRTVSTATRALVVRAV